MSEPAEYFLETPGGRFRVLEWPGSEPPVLWLHGLTAVAESWAPTIRRLRPARHSFALDQRGHGRSTPEVPDPRAIALARDAVAVTNTLGLDRPHLVGHSMGARVAIVAAARFPATFRSAAIVDIGPEAWRQNWVDTVTALERMGDRLPPGEVERIVSRRSFEPEVAAAFRARFATQPDGSHHALGSREAMKEIVRTQRSRSYWREWERISIPLLLVRGGATNEVRTHIATRMRDRNPRARYVELPGCEHNIPLLDPAGLAATLSAFWQSIE